MENKDRLDEFMQRKFAEDDPERRLAFQEDYWLQAQALIEADERRRKRRRALWWWWLSGGAGVLLALGWWWQAGSSVALPQPGAGLSTSAVEQDTSGMAHHPMARPGNGSAGRSVAPTADVVAAAKQGRGDARPRQSNNSAAFPEPVLPRLTGAVSGSKSPGDSGRFQTPKSGNLPTGVPNVGTGLREGHTDAPDATAIPVEPQTTTPLMPDPVAGAVGIAPRDTSSRGSGRSAPSEGQIPARLPLRWPPLLPRVRQLKQVSVPPPPVAESPIPHHDWQLDLSAHALVTTPTGYLANEKWGWGLGLSLGLQRKGSPVSFHAGTQWRRQQGNAPDSVFVESSEQIRYSFGYIVDQTQHQIGALQWLEFPLFGQYHWRQFDASAGVVPAFLLSLHGKETQTQSTSLKPDPTVVQSRSVGLQNHFVASTNARLFLGAGWRPMARLHLALQVQYQPGALFKAPIDTYDTRRRNSVWLGLQLGYVFFHTK